MPTLTRREFCLATGAAVAATACGENEGPPDAGQMDLASPDLTVPPDLAGQCLAGGTKFDCGPPSAVAVGQAVFFQVAHVFLCRDALGVYALSSRCTHAGCDVSFQSTVPDFFCPCHCSQFGFDGSLQAGPAPVGLFHLAMCLDQNGNVVVDTRSSVPPNTRLPEPDV
jgi:Rieske Fe-S protein